MGIITENKVMRVSVQDTRIKQNELLVMFQSYQVLFLFSCSLITSQRVYRKYIDRQQPLPQTCSSEISKTGCVCSFIKLQISAPSRKEHSNGDEI